MNIPKMAGNLLNPWEIARQNRQPNGTGLQNRPWHPFMQGRKQ
ncbi:MAG: hypothetical protein OZSIB_2866 [Candidatus Ozemobacter sibiricus]|uniref:Uncharacterized protein n=1 Tax=Candidatus Ozemobacter sibiricus TaxID=2268124 RepID=A0A367ZR13_9BACT|nr:MAG: hypothetical protein OZSIB_2866 [Candidatus Ozemobacter sibiricus]